MAGRTRGHVVERSRGHWAVVIDRGDHPYRKCATPKCSGSKFTSAAGQMACERCGAELDPPKMQRRREWHSGYTSATAAKKALAAVLVEVDQGTHVEPTTMTLREYVERTWRPGIEVSDLRPTTRDLYLRTTTNWILPTLGEVKLRDIGPATLARWLNGLRTDDVGARTIELAGTTAHKILASAFDLELIARNPADNKEVRKARGVAKAPAPTVWTADQTRAFLDSQREDRLYPLWRLLVTTGLRRGEVAGLRWSSVDLDKGSLTISATRVVVGWEVVESVPKTEKSGRTIGLDPGTVLALREHLARQHEERKESGVWRLNGGLVFVDEIGRPYHPTYLTRTLATRAKAAGLPVVKLHALRHGHATHALESGVALPTISKRLGHASVRITGDTYQHVTAAVDQAAAEQVANLYDEASVAVR